MQTISKFINRFKRNIKTLGLLLPVVFCAIQASAQNPQVSVTVNILPPYSPYYSDYSGIGAGKVLLIVRNLTSTQKKIKITGELKGDNGVKITTKSTYIPIQPIILQPNETKQLNGTALKDVFDLNTLNVYGIDKVKLVQTSRLPEGNYTFCLQAVDMNTNQTVSAMAPSGCTSFNISYPNAPILLSPTAFEKKEATTVQSIIFNWMNAGVVPNNTQYIIQVVEMPDIASDPNQVLNATTIFMLNQRIIGTNYVYGIGNVPLKIGKKYAWRVIASDPSNKTGFMNDGKSQANVFIYGSSTQIQLVDPSLISSASLLNVVSPACNISPNVYIGVNNNLKFKWLWKEQIQSTKFFGSLDSNLLDNYTKVAVSSNGLTKSSAGSSGGLKATMYETIKYYKILISLKKGKLGKPNIEYVINSPKQYLEYTMEQVTKLGLIVGNSYRLYVTAYNDNDKEIAKAESCEWVLTAEPSKPKLVIKGKIKYSFDQSAYYAANNATFRLQIVDAVNATIATTRSKTINGRTTVEYQKIAYSTTDNDGNFITNIDQLDGDTSARYVAIEMLSPYYQKSYINLAVNIPKMKQVMELGKITYKQDTVTLGDFKVNAYSYSLTVNIFKQFDKQYTTTIQNASGQNVSTNVNLESQLVNAKTTVDAGLLVGIYRKAKKSDIPSLEGDLNQGKPIFPIEKGYTRVAEGKTIVKDGKTQVFFDKLLLSFASDDEYYIQLILPKSDPKKLLADDLDDLAAPENRLSFYPNNFKAWQQNYVNAIDYKIISKKPPTALVKGKIMEQWPSTPGVLHPFANKFFNIRLNLEASFPDDYSELLKTDDCRIYPSKLQKKVTTNGVTTWQDFTEYGGKQQKVVASGKTDKDGNYEIAILDFLEMKDYDVQIVRTSVKAFGPTCQEQKDIAKKILPKTIKDKAATVINPGDYTLGGMLEQYENILKQTGKGLGGENLESNLGSSRLEGNLEIINFAQQTSGSSASSGGYAGFTGGNFSSSNMILNGNSHGVAKQAASAVKKLNVTTGVNLQYLVKNEDEQENLAETGLIEDPVVSGTANRYFNLEGVEGNYFHLIKPVSTMNNDLNQTVDRFQVQPFGTVNLGIAVVEVKEIRNLQVKIIVDKQPDNVALNGAKLVIFRLDNNFLPDYVPPIGEGSPVHPNKLLINASYSPNSTKYTTGYDSNYSTAKKVATNAYNKNFEWVLEYPLDVQLGAGNTGTFDLSDKRLWAYGNYMAIVTPNPTGDGGRFEPFIFTLATSGVQEIKVNIAPSRIAGRVIDKSSGNAIAGASVTTQVYPVGQTSSSSKIVITDANGYFELTNGANGLTWKDNEHFRSYATATGYNNVPPMKYYSVNSVNSLTIVNANGRNYNKNIEKTPGSITKFLIYGEQPGSNLGNITKPINAFIKREDGTVFTEAEASAVGVPMLTGITQKYVIIPEDPGYFGDTVNVTGGEKAYQNISLKRLKHRLNFSLKDENGNVLSPNSVKVSINGQTGQTKNNSIGSVQFEFENVSVNNYTVQFTDLNKSGYIPKIVGISNPESKLAKQYDIVMEKGAKISGQVMVGNQYAKFANVYVHYNSSDAIVTDKEKNDVSLMETRTDQYGKYEIFGLPIKDNQKVTIHATLAATPDMPYSIKGEEKEVTITNKVGTADFLLSIFTGPVITNLYGFPLTIEKIESINSTQTKVTGIVDLTKNYSKFTGLSVNKIRVSNVIFDVANKNQPTQSVPLEAISQLKMRYQDKYNVLLESTSGTLKIQKSDKGGFISGKVSIVDNSFNYPSSYINFTSNITKKTIPFYLSVPGVTASVPNQTLIKAIYNDKVETDKYLLSDPLGYNLRFNFVGFDAIAKKANSYIANDGKIHLDIKFTGNVPNATPSDVDVEINDLVLDGNKIYPSQGAYPLILNMQDWKLEVRDWTIDPVKGGIYSQNSLIKTGVVDIPVKTFNLRKDDFIVKNFSLNMLSLGSGLLNLVEIDTTNFHLVYDQSCGSDQTAHWRFSGSAKGNGYVAKIPVEAVDGKFPATALNVNYFQLISYNKENLISLSGAQSGVKIYNNPLFTFYPQSVSSSLGSYSLGGQGAIAVPRVNNVAMNLMFQKTDGKMDMQVGGLKLDFEGKGYVHYKNDPSKLITSLNGITTIAGTVSEPEKVNPIDCSFKFGYLQPGAIELVKGFDLNLDGVGTPTAKSLKLTISSVKADNGMFVKDNDWSLLKFSGELTDPNSEKMIAKKPVYYFEVLGDISASAKGIEMQKTTPLGDVKMTYDFASRRMMGSMHMDKVAFGDYSFTGDVEIGYGGDQGFLLMGSGQLNTGTLFLVGGDGFGTFNIGLLFANADLSDNSIQRVTQYSKAKDNICWLEDNRKGFLGFFLTGGYDIINEHKGFDMVLASVYLNALLGVEASIGANFNKGSYRVLVGAHGDVNAGMSAISGTSIKGGIKAHVTAAADYSQDGFGVSAEAGVNVTYIVSQYFVLDTLTFDGSQDAKINFGYQKGATNFKFTLGKAEELKCQK